jgi:hypothetical protein
VLGDCLGFGAGWVLLREGLDLESMAPLRERESTISMGLERRAQHEGGTGVGVRVRLR